MNSNTQNQSQLDAHFQSTVEQVCLATCRRLIEQTEKAKDAILAQFRGTAKGHEQLFRLAMTEAEALAWQTPYPHLVFPVLAEEKAQAVATWQKRQQLLLNQGASLAFAA
jgi:hypothetical protein